MLYTGSHSMEPQMMSTSALESCTCWTLWAMGMGSELEWEVKWLKQSARTMSFPGLYLIVYSYFCICRSMH